MKFIYYFLFQRGISGRGLEPSRSYGDEGGFSLIIIGLFIFIIYMIIKGVKEKKTQKSHIEFSTIQDIEGNNYKTVKIGKQEWMAENLRVSSYNNSDPIKEVQDRIKWRSLSEGAWCNYNNDHSNDYKFGKLYNWHAINDPRGIAPKGWRIPTKQDWHELITYLGGEHVAGKKLKKNEYWKPASLADLANNESGFSAIGCGSRTFYKSDTTKDERLMLGLPSPIIDFPKFTDQTIRVIFWSATEINESAAYNYELYHGSYKIFKNIYNGDKNYGYSIRCVRDK